MIFIKPSFYDKFKCIASRCKDNCCIGWEVDVDEDTYASYKNLQGDFADIIRENIVISSEGDRCFKLREGDRCPFLNRDNLCDIIINCGENALCDICKEHPRFYEWFPGVTECGLGLSCEEVSRILLSDDSPLELVEYNDGEKIEFDDNEDIILSDTYVFYSALRTLFFDILKKRDVSFEEKIVNILSETEKFTKESIKIKSYINTVKEYEKTEPINEEWTEFIKALREKIEEISAEEEKLDEESNGDMLYSKILAYLLYRHFSKSAFDNSICERVRFCVEGIRFIKLCDMKTYFEKGMLTLADRIENLKNWSKQVEYSEENTEILIYGDK